MTAIMRQNTEIAGKSSPFPFDNRSGGGRDEVLDGLRAVAVMFVVLAHAALFRFGADFDKNAPLLKPLLGLLGMVGVKMFFLISGYVITRLLLLELRATGSIRLRRFYLRRFTRIVPQFALYVFTIAVLSHFVYLYVPKLELLSAALFLCNTSVYECGWFVGHSWTLAVEEQFYLAFPVLLKLADRRRIPALLLVLTALLLAIGLYRAGTGNANEVSFSFIAFGAIAAALPTMQALVVRFVTGAVLVIVFVGFTVLTAVASGAVEILLSPLLLSLLVFGMGNVRWARLVLMTSPVQAIGRCSYTIYIWQELFLGMPRYYFASLPPLWLFPIVIFLAWTLVERPAMAFGRRMLRSSVATVGRL